MLAYRVELLKRPKLLGVGWAWKVHSWYPDQSLLARGVERSREEAERAALAIIDKTRRDACYVFGGLHLNPH